MTRTGCLLLVVILAAAPARAHDRSVSFPTGRLGADGARVTVRLAAIEATRLPWAAGDAGRLGTYWTEHLRLLAGDVPCPAVEAARPVELATGDLGFEWRVACPGSGPRRIESDALLDVAPSHLHFAHVRMADGTSAEHVLSDAVRTAAVDAPAPPSIPEAVRLGIEHILSGWDHLAFVLA